MTGTAASRSSGVDPAEKSAETSPTPARDRLIQAAISLVAESGLSTLTYRSLAARAGVTHGAVQHHFASIDDVLEAALNWTVETSLATLRSSSTPRAFLDDVRSFIEGASDIQAFQFQLSLESRRRATLRPIVLGLYELYWEAAATALRARGAEPDRAVVRAVMAAAEGVVFQHAVLGDDDPDGVEASLEGLQRLLDAAVPEQ